LALPIVSEQNALATQDPKKQGVRHGTEECVIQEPLVLLDERVELMGQREDHMKIGHGQKIRPGLTPIFLPKRQLLKEGYFTFGERLLIRHDHGSSLRIQF
jgi:hypothetical protein